MIPRLPLLSGMVFGVVLCGSAQASGISMLRITCEGDAVNAGVSINGHFRGDCPLDVQVAPGSVRIDVVKKVDQDTERSFSQEFRMGEGTVRRVEVTLGRPQLNPAARQLAEERDRVARQAQEEQRRKDEAARAEQRRRDAESLTALQAAAAQGDHAAMLALGDRYAAGAGVEKNVATATEWYGKAKAAGNDAAGLKVAATRKALPAPQVEEAVRVLSLPREPDRKVDVHGDKAVRAFIDSDPFFDLPAGGGGDITFSTRLPNGTSVPQTCHRSGRMLECELKISNITTRAVAGLGGLLGNVDNQTDNGSLFQAGTRVRITDIDSVDGHPFPLVPGKRFGVRFTSAMTGRIDDLSYQQRMSCAAAESAEEAIPVSCVLEQSGLYTLVRMAWDARAGGFAWLSTTTLF